MAMNSEELQPVGWLSEVVLEGSDQPVRVVLDSREGNRVFVRQADPEDGDDPPRVPLFPGDELIVMQALTHVSHHITPDVGRTDDLLFSTRIVPVRREPGRVFARTLRRNEPDQGTRVHIRPGDELTFEVGAVVAELDAIDDSEQEATVLYAPLTPVLWTWLQLGTGRSEATVRYLLAAARRLDTAARLLGDVDELRATLKQKDLSGPALRRAFFGLIGTVELAVIALGRSIDMVTRALSLIGTTVPVPTNITNSIQAVSEIRNAYEHIEDRALGRVRQKPDPQALTIFDYRRLLDDDEIVYAGHSLNLVNEVPTLLRDARQYLKDVAGGS
jgi:hypothetical protein